MLSDPKEKKVDDPSEIYGSGKLKVVAVPTPDCDVEYQVVKNQPVLGIKPKAHEPRGQARQRQSTSE